MSDATAQTHPIGPFWKTAFALWILSLIGTLFVLPYVATLEHAALAAAARRTHFSVPQLLALSGAQTALLLLAVVAGLWASRRLGLATPLITALLTRTAAPRATRWTLLLAFGLGAVATLVLMLLDQHVFAPIPSVARLVHAAGSGSARPSAWQGLLASFYGALDEEILMRLGLMSLLALALRAFARMAGASREMALPATVFWTANIVTAVLFGLGHLPATAALAPLSTPLVIRAIVLNGTVGILFGALYRRFGLEWAMVSHFGVDIVAHVALG